MTSSDTSQQTKTTYLICMLGHAGSGKSFFARKLALHKNWVRLNGDSMRMALFGSLEEMYKYDTSLRREGIFRAVDYSTEQILASHQSVIYDANNNRRQVRKEEAKLAERYGAVPIVVWVIASKDMGIERSKGRDEQFDQRKLNHEAAASVVERHIADTDEPEDDEQVIKIDGTASFEEQLESFNTQMKELGYE